MTQTQSIRLPALLTALLFAVPASALTTEPVDPAAPAETTRAPAAPLEADAPTDTTAAPEAEAVTSETAPASAPTARPIDIAQGEEAAVRRGNHWNLDVDLAYGLTFQNDERRQSAMARVRAGWLLIHEPWYPSLGVYADVSNTLPSSFGVQVETVHLWTGLWGQLGLFVDVKPRVGVSLAAGYSIVGVEANGRFREDKTILWSVFGKLRIPIGFLALAFSQDR